MNSIVSPFEVHERRKIVRFIFGTIIFIEIYLLLSNTLLHQFQQPVFKYLDLDITYYLFHTTRIHSFLIGNHIISMAFDYALFGFSILCFLHPLKRVYLIGFYSFFFCYLITRNTYALSHDHLFHGVIFAVFPFLFRSNITAKFLWEFVRYIHLFVFSSAFFWKLFRGSCFEYNHLESIIKLNLTSYLIENPKSIYTDLYTWLFLHPDILYTLWVLAIAMEALFIIGFFTKKYDLKLFYIGISLHICFYFFADALYFPILIMSFSLLNFNRSIKKNE